MAEKYLAFQDCKGNPIIYGWVPEEQYDALLEREVARHQNLSEDGTCAGFRQTTQAEIEEKWDAITY